MTRVSVASAAFTPSHAHAARCASGRRATATTTTTRTVAARSTDDDGANANANAPLSRRCATWLTAAALATSSRPRAADGAQNDLIARVRAKSFSKPVFNSSKPRAQTYPAWLAGEWDATVDFAGYEFPSAVPKEVLAREPTVPGFQKLSLAFIPDVGSDRLTYRIRFVQTAKGDVVEDRAFNLAEVQRAYLARDDAVDGVEYDPDVDPNRTTIRYKSGVTNNAERIELFTNARESETRASDGTFFASEAFRQVTLGYSTTYGVARVQPTDYQHVWTYTPLEDPNDDREGVVNRVKVTLSTAGYVQPNDALKLTAQAAPRANANAAPVPQVGAASSLAFEPVVLYSHVMTLTRVGCVP